MDGAGHYVDHRFVTFTPVTSHSDNAEGTSVLSKIASAAEAITLNQSPTAGSIQAANKTSEPSSSVYEDESLGLGTKSVTVRSTYGSLEKTLSGNEIDQCEKSILNSLSSPHFIVWPLRQ